MRSGAASPSGLPGHRSGRTTIRLAASGRKARRHPTARATLEGIPRASSGVGPPACTRGPARPRARGSTRRSAHGRRPRRHGARAARRPRSGLLQVPLPARRFGHERLDDRLGLEGSGTKLDIDLSPSRHQTKVRLLLEPGPVAAAEPGSHSPCSGDAARQTEQTEVLR
jgi:hypothetical protein